MVPAMKTWPARIIWIFLFLLPADRMLAQQPETSSDADAMARAAKLLNEHHLDEAIALLSRLEQKDPRPPGLDAKLGKAYYEKRDYALAITHL